MIKRISFLAACVLCFVALSPSQAQERPAAAPAAPPDLTLDAPARAQLIEAVIREMKDYYVFPEAAQQVEKILRERMKEYEKLTSAKELAKTLTTDLREVTHDKHVSVNYSAEPRPVQQEQAEPTERERQGIRNYGDAINYGFEKIERLPGNIGYIRLNLFFPPEYGGETAVAAMKVVNSTEALIIDLRGNDGGHPGMIQLVASYFFGAEPVQLSGIFHRRTNSTQQYWTLPYVPGAKYLKKEVYILTSRRTFSGGEAFAYDLKNLKRATLVGETTEGAANPRDVRRLSDHFWMGIPNARAVSPITNTNWEGVGVKPDVE
ncbi:MAG: S41 family peptidase, partial [Acidobacteria bacterium]|nr:S41 family peptidase [Acidobacteriota bacterium]